MATELVVWDELEDMGTASERTAKHTLKVSEGDEQSPAGDMLRVNHESQPCLPSFPLEGPADRCEEMTCGHIAETTRIAPSVTGVVSSKTSPSQHRSTAKSERRTMEHGCSADRSESDCKHSQVVKLL